MTETYLDRTLTGHTVYLHVSIYDMSSDVSSRGTGGLDLTGHQILVTKTQSVSVYDAVKWTIYTTLGWLLVVALRWAQSGRTVTERPNKGKGQGDHSAQLCSDRKVPKIKKEQKGARLFFPSKYLSPACLSTTTTEGGSE